MQRKLFFSFLAIILLALGISSITFWSRGYDFIDKQSNNHYLTQANLVADLFIKENIENSDDYYTFVQRYAKKYNFRITIINYDGTVLADSETSESLENHGTREEVVRALNGESNTINRYSKTMGQEYSYSAVPVSNDNFSGVIRVSVPLSELKALNNDLEKSIIYAIIICLIIALIAAFFFTRLIAKPMNDVANAAHRISEGDYNIKIYTRDKNEVGKLAESFNIMTSHLKYNIENLEQRNVELEAMLSSMTGGVVAINDSNEVLFYNKAFLEIVKPVNEHIMGQSLYNVLRNAALFEAIDYVRENNWGVSKEGTIARDETVHIRITATPLESEEKSHFGVLLIIEDVTQLKKLETIRSDFVSNVTHELKTPLTSIRGFIDTLKSGAIKEETVAVRFLDIIDIEAERLFSLIQDILLLSEIESKREYETIACDINELTNSVIDLLQPKLTDKVDIEFEPEPYLKPFPCNPDRIKQLLINLMDNAIKYTEAGTITVKCKEVQNSLIIQVKDTGIGIGREYLPRIFERFYRVDKGRSRKQGGTGLGLSIVKHIVELYNGNIHVDSEPGEGTEFTITLPYNEKAQTNK